MQQIQEDEIQEEVVGVGNVALPTFPMMTAKNEDTDSVEGIARRKIADIHKKYPVMYKNVTSLMKESSDERIIVEIICQDRGVEKQYLIKTIDDNLFISDTDGNNFIFQTDIDARGFIDNNSDYLVCNDSSTGTHDYSSLQYSFNTIFQQRILDFSNNLFEEQDIIELEDYPHLTIKYGILDVNPDILFGKMIDSRYRHFFPIFLEDTIVFEADDVDVVVVSCYSELLNGFNTFVKESVETIDTFSNYNPHITLGYVKKGMGRKYKGKHLLIQVSCVPVDIEFSSKDGTIYKFSEWLTQQNL